MNLRGVGAVISLKDLNGLTFHTHPATSQPGRSWQFGLKAFAAAGKGSEKIAQGFALDRYQVFKALQGIVTCSEGSNLTLAPEEGGPSPLFTGILNDNRHREGPIMKERISQTIRRHIEHAIMALDKKDPQELIYRLSMALFVSRHLEGRGHHGESEEM
jgi:hypothetical protein